MNNKENTGLGRRDFLLSAAVLAAVPTLAGFAAPAAAQTPGTSLRPASVSGRRKLLGMLEVSTVGLGVQNMSRTYQQTIPTRPEMYKHCHPDGLRTGRHILRRG